MTPSTVQVTNATSGDIFIETYGVVEKGATETVPNTDRVQELIANGAFITGSPPDGPVPTTTLGARAKVPSAVATEGALFDLTETAYWESEGSGKYRPAATVAVAAEAAARAAADADLTTALGTKANASSLAAKQSTSEKNQAGGYAGLDGSGKLAVGQMPDLSALDSEVAAAVAAIGGRFRGPWAAATDYKAKDIVLRPSDSAMVYANADFTSAGSYSGSNWTALPSGSGGAPTGPAVGTTIGDTTIDGSGNPTVTFTSGWGINSSGDPYYDTAGAAAGEDAVLIVDPTTSGLAVVQPTGVTT